jgi:hypothetical protein
MTDLMLGLKILSLSATCQRISAFSHWVQAVRTATLQLTFSAPGENNEEPCSHFPILPYFHAATKLSAPC